MEVIDVKVKAASPSAQLQSSGKPSLAAASHDKSKGESVASAVVSDVTHLTPSKTICHFSCKYCGDLAKEPVINVICGHMFCWTCLYRWLKPRGPGQQASRRGCPFCKSHVDISPSMATVTPVYSGPAPGIEFSHYRNPELVPDEEEERNREKEEGEAYVAPRPGLLINSQYACKIDFATVMLVKLKNARYVWNEKLELLRNRGPNPFILSAQKVINDLIKDLRDSLLWLTGNTFGSDRSDIESGKVNEGELDIVLVPTDVKIPDISTFACRICEKTAFEPVVASCGHLFCWTCLLHKFRDVPECPICEFPVDLLVSRADISSIYCTLNDPCKEDEFLKSRREDFKLQETQAPCRPPQHVASLFLDHMISKVDEVGNMMIERLTDFQLKYSGLSFEQIGRTCSELSDMCDDMYADLVKEWRKHTGEQEKESQLLPTFLDLIFDELVVTSKDDGHTECEPWVYVSHYIGKTEFD